MNISISTLNKILDWTSIFFYWVFAPVRIPINWLGRLFNSKWLDIIAPISLVHGIIVIIGIGAPFLDWTWPQYGNLLGTIAAGLYIGLNLVSVIETWFNFIGSILLFFFSFLESLVNWIFNPKDHAKDLQSTMGYDAELQRHSSALTRFLAVFGIRVVPDVIAEKPKTKTKPAAPTPSSVD